jgi:hypothetical protein
MKIKLKWGSLDSNYHGTERKGESWNRQPVRGPKFRHVRLTVHAPSTGHRFIFYLPSGAWRHLDVYFDRRNK